MTEHRKSDWGQVVITGASSGIGKACAIHLNEIGFHVFAGVRKALDAENLKQETSSRITPLLIDITDTASIASAAETVTKAVGEAGLAGLVNNAGIVVSGPLEFLDVNEMQKQFDVNVFGHIAVTQAFLPLIRKARGRIVNISSDSGTVALPFVGPYCASKFALEAFSDSLRVELYPWGIKVSIIKPGNVATPIWKKSIASGKEIERNLPTQAHNLYDQAFTAVRKAVEKSAKNVIPPAAVARAVAHALTSRMPKTRYIVGMDARLQIFMKKILPDKIFDWFVVRFLGLKKQP